MKQYEIDVILKQRTRDRRMGQVNDISLCEADLRGLNLTYANLTNADLDCADLRGADLSESWLTGAYLIGANLTGAIMDDCTVRGADLESAIGIVRLDMTDPREFQPIAVNHGGAWRIYSSCRSFTVPEALAHWSNPEYAGDPEIAARYVRAINALPKCPEVTQ